MTTATLIYQAQRCSAIKQIHRITRDAVLLPVVASVSAVVVSNAGSMLLLRVLPTISTTNLSGTDMVRLARCSREAWQCLRGELPTFGLLAYAQVGRALHLVPDDLLSASEEMSLAVINRSFYDWAFNSLRKNTLDVMRLRPLKNAYIHTETLH